MISSRWILAGVLFLGCGCREEILHDLDELHANQVQLVLDRAGIESDKSRVGALWMVSVPRSRTAGALGALEKSRVLWRDLSRFKSQTGGLIQSREERAQESERQTSWTMEQTLERLPGVLEARVQLQVSLPDPELSGPSPSRKGSVLLVVNAVLHPSVEEVRQLVSGGTGIEASSITVLIAEQGGGDTSGQRDHIPDAVPIEPKPLSPQYDNGFRRDKRLHILLEAGTALCLLLALLRVRSTRPRELLLPRTERVGGGQEGRASRNRKLERAEVF